MPASSTTTTVFLSQPNALARCPGVDAFPARSARAIVIDSSATASPTMTSAALPVGARPTTVFPARSQEPRAALSDEVLPAPAGATITLARYGDFTTWRIADA